MCFWYRGYPTCATAHSVSVGSPVTAKTAVGFGPGDPNFGDIALEGLWRIGCGETWQETRVDLVTVITRQETFQMSANVIPGTTG
jgi:hypothetical protein